MSPATSTTFEAPLVFEVVTPALRYRPTPGTWETSPPKFLFYGQRVTVDPKSRVDDGVRIWYRHSLGWSSIGKRDGSEVLMRQVSLQTPNGVLLPVAWATQIYNPPLKFACGQADVLMLLKYYGKAGNQTVHTLYKIEPGLTDAVELQALAARFGVYLKLRPSPNKDIPGMLRELLDAGRPVILLVNYKDLRFVPHLASGTDQGLHWLVVVGYEADEFGKITFFVNDSLWATTQRSGQGGRKLPISAEQLVEAARMQLQPALA